MGLRAQRKKASRKFAVGDLVTWGLGVTAHKVVAVDGSGVYVDASSTGFSRRYFVPFVPTRKYGEIGEPLRHASASG